MKRLLAVPRMLRLPNLAIVFLTQWIPYWWVLRPAILRAGGIPVLTERTFGLIAATTLLTTLAGYIINDFYDYRMDAINRPQRVVVGRILPPLLVLFIYLVLVGGVFYLAFRLDAEMGGALRHWPLWVFPAVSFLLFLYAWQLKCTAVVGNLLVSSLCAVVPVITLLPEDRPLWLTSFRQPEAIQEASALLWIYALFAFMTNLLREQIKDLEDYAGDAACGCGTLAALKGTRYAQKPAGFTGLTVSVLIGFLIYYWKGTGASDVKLLAAGMLLLAPALVATFLVFSATVKRHFSWASAFVKWVMLVGVLMLVPQWPAEVRERVALFWHM